MKKTLSAFTFGVLVTALLTNSMIDQLQAAQKNVSPENHSVKPTITLNGKTTEISTGTSAEAPTESTPTESAPVVSTSTQMTKGNTRAPSSAKAPIRSASGTGSREKH